MKFQKTNSVYQYDLDGKFIRKHPDMRKLCRDMNYNVKVLSDACLGKLDCPKYYGHEAYGFMWLKSWQGATFGIRATRPVPLTLKHIKSGELVTFDSIIEAAQYLKCDESSIRKVRRSVKGHEVIKTTH